MEIHTGSRVVGRRSWSLISFLAFGCAQHDCVSPLIALSFDHGEVGHFHPTLPPVPSLEGPSNTVPHLKVCVGHVCRQTEFKIWVGTAMFKSARNAHGAVSVVRHFALGWDLFGPHDFDDLAFLATPPRCLEDPVREECRSRPTLVREQKHLARVPVILQDFPAAFASVFVIEQLHHLRPVIW